MENGNERQRTAFYFQLIKELEMRYGKELRPFKPHSKVIH